MQALYKVYAWFAKLDIFFSQVHVFQAVQTDIISYKIYATAVLKTAKFVQVPTHVHSVVHICTKAIVYQSVLLLPIKMQLITNARVARIQNVKIVQ